MVEVESRHIKVLLIEDDEDDCILIRSLLSEVPSATYESTWIPGYTAALKELDSGNYDICLLDYRLGSRNGLDILRKTEGGSERPPIIVLTGHGDYRIDVEAMKHGAADYLVKGEITADVLERAIRYAMDRRKAQDALRESEKQLKHLSAQLLIVQENERRKVAGELHDNLSQLLTALKFNIENIITRMDPDASCTGDLKALVPFIQGAVEQVRNMYTHLMPTILDDLGITATLNWYCREFLATNPDIEVFKEFEVDENKISQDLKLIIFRIVQEAMENVAHHGSADYASLRLFEENGGLRLDIEDNGKGFDVDRELSLDGGANGLGLMSMKRRAELSGGSFDIESTVGQGTLIRINWAEIKNQ